jgi:hypothetical protein
MLASHLSALCWEIDLLKLEQMLVKMVLGVILRFSEAFNLFESIKGKIINVSRGILVYTYLESPCDPFFPLLSALKHVFLDSILAFHDIQIVDNIKEFESHLKQKLE